MSKRTGLGIGLVLAAILVLGGALLLREGPTGDQDTTLGSGRQTPATAARPDEGPAQQQDNPVSYKQAHPFHWGFRVSLSPSRVRSRRSSRCPNPDPPL